MNKIVTSYIVIVDHKPAIMLSDKKKVNKIAEIAKEKGKEVLVRQVTATEDRVNEIGRNLFKIKIEESLRRQIELFRNRAVVGCIQYKEDKGVDEEIAWRRVNKNLAPSFTEMSFSEFCQWTLDVREYR